MHKTTVGVLRGGPSSFYNESLASGANVLKYLPEKYKGKDIFIDRNGIWHVDGFPYEPHDALKQVDIAWNALHGEYGADGGVQKILEVHNIPFTGSGALASSLGNQNHLLKQIFEDNEIQTPSSYIIEDTDDIDEIVKYMFENVPLPLVIKPTQSFRHGTTIPQGITIVKSYHMLAEALHNAFAYTKTVLIEEFIRGKEAVTSVIENMRDKKLYSSLPLQITADRREIYPGDFTLLERSELERVAAAVHKALNMRHYSSTTMVVTPKRGVYVLHTSTHPPLGKESALPVSLGAVGIDFSDFLGHVIDLARGAV